MGINKFPVSGEIISFSRCGIDRLVWNSGVIKLSAAIAEKHKCMMHTTAKIEPLQKDFN
ncbi:hypothetical protein ACFL5V_09080 [Fibrobacterota bacterium]